MNKSSIMKSKCRKIFNRSSLCTIISIAVMCGIIICIIAAAPMAEEPELKEVDLGGNVVRIEAPTDEIDMISRGTAAPESEHIDFPAPSFTSPESGGSASQETTGIKTSTPETVSTETASPVTTMPETIAPETTAPAATAQETVPPETTAPETTVPETTPAPVVETALENETLPEPEPMLADKYGVDYIVDEPDFEVDEHWLKMAATVIQLEVMGHLSEVDAFEDTTQKYTEMLAVAQIIRNRVDSDKFPDSVEEVLLQKIGNNYQFWKPETLELYVPYVTDGAVAAAREVLVDGVKVFDDDFFYFVAVTVEAEFEERNGMILVKEGNSYKKWKGHMTTFYAGPND